MINTNELRIRNFLNWESEHAGGGFSEVIAISKLGYKIKSIHGFQPTLDEYDQVNPIPLTPEWLERCGFKDDGGNMWSGPEIENDDSIEYFTIKKKNAGFYFYGSEWTHGKPFLYVHQFQNLYFALTGEELQIKMP
jgi:hypothetical protein